MKSFLVTNEHGYLMWLDESDISFFKNYKVVREFPEVGGAQKAFEEYERKLTPMVTVR